MFKDENPPSKLGEESVQASADSAEQVSLQEPTPASDTGERAAIFSKKKNWWRRFLAGEPPDPRIVNREPLHGLIAYFFTGGAPVMHEVRDISMKGLYVLTEERWYIGTVVRVTLTDKTEPTAERSLTLNAQVARWGKDGVGMHFILRDPENRKLKSTHLRDEIAASPTVEQVAEFISRHKANR